jgi:hypothetical protein
MPIGAALLGLAKKIGNPIVKGCQACYTLCCAYREVAVSLAAAFPLSIFGWLLRVVGSLVRFSGHAQHCPDSWLKPGRTYAWLESDFLGFPFGLIRDRKPPGR